MTDHTDAAVKKAADILSDWSNYSLEQADSLAGANLLRTAPADPEIEAAARESYEASGPKGTPWEELYEDLKRSYRNHVTVIINSYIKGAHQ